MERIDIPPRLYWKEEAEKNGFFYHHVNGELYWDESAYYCFSLEEIEKQLEAPAQEIHNMCMDLVDNIVHSEELLTKLQIPNKFWDYISNSWKNPYYRDLSLYGRFDFCYDGKNPAKLLEYNADTPTSLYEASYFQWLWLEDMNEANVWGKQVDQFNSIQEKLIDAFIRIRGLLPKQVREDIVYAKRFRIIPAAPPMRVPTKIEWEPIYFASMKGSEEDRATVTYIMDCAMQAAIDAKFIYMEDIGVKYIDDKPVFVDLEDNPINFLFKLYPWEFIWKDKFADVVIESDTKFIEPPWKMILSNKGILPLLWERHPNHPNLLPAGFGEMPHGELPDSEVEKFIVKPLLSREGANIKVYEEGIDSEACEMCWNKVYYTENAGYGREGYIWQKYCQLPDFEGNYPVCGLWIVDGKSCGLGIREDKSPITTDTSRFVSHIILD